MQIFSEKQMLERIASGESFEGILQGGGVIVRMLEQVPYICTAIHNGDRLRSSLSEKCLLSAEERKQQEDPHTGDFIRTFPITLEACDSRYEYDLNRSPEDCLYEIAWGEKVWKRPLSVRQKAESLEKHRVFYRLLEAIYHRLRRLYSQVLLFDLHSFNWKVIPRPFAPVFNIGTHQLDMRRWSPLVRTFEKGLNGITLPNLDVSVGRDVVFEGRGYLATFCKQELGGMPVIPLEIKKVFMDEETGEVFPLVMEELQQGLQDSIRETAAHFSRNLKRAGNRGRRLASTHLEATVLKVDKALYRLAKGIDTLYYVNPINLNQERKKFLARRDYVPNFRYRQLRIDPHSFREALYQLPVSAIQDVGLRRLYRDIINSYATKIELLTQIGRPQFLYNSLRYYGEPDAFDLANAHFILHAPPLPGAGVDDALRSAEEAAVIFDKAARGFGLSPRISLSSRIVANAMVDNSRQTLLINSSRFFSNQEIAALISHELGVHLATSHNASCQPLKVLKLGLPGNTYTQEGLAVLSEYLTGNMSLDRLKLLALRVIAVSMMVSGASFAQVFSRLEDEFGQKPESAFTMTARVFRGGGLTKDFLYLRGFSDMVQAFRGRSLAALFAGKTSIDYIDLLDDLLNREILSAPQVVPEEFSRGMQGADAILDYLINGLCPKSEQPTQAA